MTQQEIARLYTEEHLSTNQIGNLCGKSGATICYYLKNMGIPRRDRSDAKLAAMGKRDFWSEERLAKLKRLYFAGKATKAIAAELGCTRNAVMGKTNRLGWFRLPTPTADTKANAAHKARIGQAQAFSQFQHRSLIDFPDPLMGRFRECVEAARIERRWA